MHTIRVVTHRYSARAMELQHTVQEYVVIDSRFESWKPGL